MREQTPPPWLGFTLVVLGLGALGCGDSPADTEGSTDEAQVSPAEDAARFFADAIAAREAVFTSDELMPYYDELPAVSVEDMIGTWRGGKFDGGKPDPINWWGKQVLSADEALGFICERPDGTLYSWELLGRASMAELEFRGVTSAALVYDNGFLTDYFRRVSEDVVVGYSPVGFGDSEDLFFHLTRVADIELE